MCTQKRSPALREQARKRRKKSPSGLHFLTWISSQKRGVGPNFMRQQRETGQASPPPPKNGANWGSRVKKTHTDCVSYWRAVAQPDSTRLLMISRERLGQMGWGRREYSSASSSAAWRGGTSGRDANRGFGFEWRMLVVCVCVCVCVCVNTWL